MAQAEWLCIILAAAEGLRDLLPIAGGCRELQLVWFGVPCETAPRARDHRLLGLGGPLRSEHFPRGLPGLGNTDQTHVDLANSVYDNMAQLIDWCNRRNVAWAIENPGNSYLWYPPELVPLLRLPGVLRL